MSKFIKSGKISNIEEKKPSDLHSNTITFANIKKSDILHRAVKRMYQFKTADTKNGKRYVSLANFEYRGPKDYGLSVDTYAKDENGNLKQKGFGLYYGGSVDELKNKLNSSRRKYRAVVGENFINKVNEIVKHVQSNSTKLSKKPSTGRSSG